MKECNICNKKLPHHIFDGHMRKWHSDTPVSIKRDPTPKNNIFNWEKEEVCGTCNEVHPAMLMRYHAHVVHGV